MRMIQHGEGGGFVMNNFIIVNNTYKCGNFEEPTCVLKIIHNAMTPCPISKTTQNLKNFFAHTNQPTPWTVHILLFCSFQNRLHH
jgi:hypothetical protein